MDYPNGFDLTVFPAARRVAVLRAISIWTCIAFLVIAALCGLFVWSRNSLQLNPYLIAITPDGAGWSVITDKTRGAPITRTDLVQESVANSFIQNVLMVSDDAETNSALWCRCDNGANDNSATPCMICKNSDSVVFSALSTRVLPLWQEKFANGETVSVGNVALSKLVGNEFSGVWKFTATLNSDTGITGFVQLGRDPNRYPLNIGFFVSDFSFYETTGTRAGQ
ncbi:MAG: hypothetical protein LBO08_02670 [Rickettsiales bacterium]|jgi:hypothetical protein|nr:hypothetical protein [Rickettsiales bacterium]